MKVSMAHRSMIVVLIFSLAVLSLGIDRAGGRPVSKPDELVFLNWSEYMDPELIKAFESAYHVRVKQAYYETDELRDEMLVQTNGVGYDVVLASALAIPPYIKQNWVVPLDASEIPNLKHIDPKWLNSRPKIKGYAAPFLWGTVGIAYRKDLLGENITSWKQLYHPRKDLRNRIVMIRDSRETIGHALKALGYSLNSNDQSAYHEVENLLIAQKPYVREYSYVALDDQSSMVKGDVWMTMIYNGDALTLKDYNPDIAFVVPKEGAFLWMDCLVVMKASKNKALAKKFINFINEPENAARLAEYLNYATPNAGAEKLLPQEHLTNPIIYPSKDVLARCEIYKDPNPRILKKRNEIFSKLTN